MNRRGQTVVVAIFTVVLVMGLGFLFLAPVLTSVFGSLLTGDKLIDLPIYLAVVAIGLAGIVSFFVFVTVPKGE